MHERSHGYKEYELKYHFNGRHSNMTLTLSDDGCLTEGCKRPNKILYNWKTDQVRSPRGVSMAPAQPRSSRSSSMKKGPCRCYRTIIDSIGKHYSELKHTKNNRRALMRATI